MDHQLKVFHSYKQQNFPNCLSIIEKLTRDLPKVLKTSCLVHVDTAHEILDEVLIAEEGNAFAYYGKGLAFMHQQKLQQAIHCFDEALRLDGSMEKAENMKQKAMEMMSEVKKEVKSESETDEKCSENKEKDDIKEKFQINLRSKAVEVEIKEEVPAAVVIVPAPSAKSKTCHICSKTFTKTFSLNRHMKLHSGERPYKCLTCDFAFIQKSDLIRHTATHGESYDYICPDCNWPFKTKKNLYSHQAKHLKDRPFQCSVCRMTFESNELLRSHENLHIFQCDFCSKTFTSKPFIKSHLMTHPSAKPFGCNLCHISYTNLDRLVKHFREYHGAGKGIY